MPTTSLSILILSFIASVGLICSPSVSLFVYNYEHYYPHQAFAASGDSSNAKASNQGDSSNAKASSGSQGDSGGQANKPSHSDGSSTQQGKQLQPTFLLLLDTAQLCQIAGDTQCVAKQNQFKTLNLVTKLDAATTTTGKTWTITGQAENTGTKTQTNVQVIAHLYDSKGNNVGGPYKGTVNPTALKSFQSGAFNIKASASAMKGTPSFVILEYQSTA